MKKNKILDTLKRFGQLKRANLFDFSYFAYLIFDKSEETVLSIKNNFPKEILISLEGEIDYILDFIKNQKNNWSEFNLNKYNLIQKIYDIFKNKRKEIQRNNNLIDLSRIPQKDLNKKVEELKNKFYSYDLISNQLSISYPMEETSRKIEAIKKDILKTEEENKKEKNNNKVIDSIIGDKFLIINENAQKVDINTKQCKLIDLLDIDNKYDSFEEIEIENIIQPRTYSIHSFMDYLGSCFSKTLMFPSFIRYAFKNKTEYQINKSINILSALFNLYNNVKINNFSLISPKIKEFKQAFEIMILTIEKSGVDFSKDQDIMDLINKLRSNDNGHEHYFIALPEKDKFQIKESYFENFY